MDELGQTKYNDSLVVGQTIVDVSEAYNGSRDGVVTITGHKVVNNEFVVAADGHLCVSANCQRAFGWIRNRWHCC